MKEKRKLSPGDRIKFVGPAIFDSGNTIYCNPFKAKVEHGEDPSDMITIRIYDYRGELENRTAKVHRRQVVSVLKPKKAPAAPERERVERWIDPSDTSQWMATTFNKKEAGMEPYMKLTEIREGERILSRADLEKAWDSSPVVTEDDLNKNDRCSKMFQHLAKALGLEEREP